MYNACHFAWLINNHQNLFLLDGSIPELTVDTPSTDEDKHTLCNTRVCADK